MIAWFRPSSLASWAGSIASTRNGKYQAMSCVPVGGAVPVACGFAGDAVFHASCRLVLPQSGAIWLVLPGSLSTWQIGSRLPSRWGMAGEGWFGGAASGLVVVYTYWSSAGILVSPFSDTNVGASRYSTCDCPGAGPGTCTSTSNCR